ERSSVQFLPVEGLDGSLSLFVRGHLNKRKTARLSRVPVGHQTYRRYRPGLRKELFQILLSCLEGQVSNVQFRSHGFSSRTKQTERQELSLVVALQGTTRCFEALHFAWSRDMSTAEPRHGCAGKGS